MFGKKTEFGYEYHSLSSLRLWLDQKIDERRDIILYEIAVKKLPKKAKPGIIYYYLQETETEFGKYIFVPKELDPASGHFERVGVIKMPRPMKFDNVLVFHKITFDELLRNGKLNFGIGQ